MTSRRQLLRHLVIISVDATEATVISPYPAASCIKALPRSERRWDPVRSLWIVVPEAVDRLVRGLTIFGFEVDVWRDGAYATHKPLTRDQFGGAA